MKTINLQGMHESISCRRERRITQVSVPMHFLSIWLLIYQFGCLPLRFELPPQLTEKDYPSLCLCEENGFLSLLYCHLKAMKNHYHLLCFAKHVKDFTLKCVLMSLTMWLWPLQSLSQNQSVAASSYKVFLKNSQWFFKLFTIDGTIYYLSSWPVDTIINGLSYKKSSVVVTSPTAVMPGILPPHGTLEGHLLLREDTIARRVYHFNQNTQTDQLLYDFSLSIGDTMPVAFNPQNYILTAIDSVLLNNGEFHRRFVFTGSSGQNVYWIEGVGNINVPFSPTSVGGLPPSQLGLICSYQNGINIYNAGNVQGINCNSLLTATHNNPQFPGIKLIPNPSINEFRIEVDGSLPHSVSVTDITGHLIYRNHFSAENSVITVDCSHWQSGIYFVKVRFKEHEVIKKFIRIE
jgi:hypothetical protein